MGMGIIGTIALAFSFVWLRVAALEGALEDIGRKKREKREREEWEASKVARRRQEKRDEIERTIDAVRSGKWPYGSVDARGWSIDQVCRLHRALDISDAARSGARPSTTRPRYARCALPAWGRLRSLGSSTARP
jgi:hypothetical protein